VIKLCDLRWRRRRKGPVDLLVGKAGDFWLMLVPRHHQIGKEDAAHDRPYATLFISAVKPFEGPSLPGSEETS
jgi:hypothetical protein